MFAPAHVRICAGKYLVLGPGPKTKFLYLTPAYSFISPGPPPCGCLCQHVKERVLSFDDAKLGTKSYRWICWEKAVSNILRHSLKFSVILQ